MARKKKKKRCPHCNKTFVNLASHMRVHKKKGTKKTSSRAKSPSRKATTNQGKEKTAVKRTTSKRRKKKRSYAPSATVRVIGIGGGGGNAVSRMQRHFTRGVEFVAINTDHQDLDNSEVKKKIYIGKNLTRGLGAGMNPDLGRQAAEENRSEIAESVRDADIVFVTAGFGGGTGSGGAPVVAEAAKEAGALTVGVVTRPFAFEGSQRERIAGEAIGKLKDKVDALIVVPNDRVFTVISEDTPVAEAFEVIDEILGNALKGIVELIVVPGIVNVDFADIRSVIEDAGNAIVSAGISEGKERAVNAATQALRSPLLEISAEGARGVVLGIASGSKDLKMSEINEAAKIVFQAADPSARIIFGAYQDKYLNKNQVKVTLIATGFNGAKGGNGRSLFSNDRSSALQRINSARPTSASPRAKMDDVDTSTEDKPEAPQGEAEEDESAWDIPTFLRKKK